MKIGYVGSRDSPALGHAISYAKERGITTIPYDNLPEAEEDIPEVMVINSPSFIDTDYPAEISKFVQAHENTRFFLLNLNMFPTERKRVREAIGEHENLEYLSPRSHCEILADFIDANAPKPEPV